MRNPAAKGKSNDIVEFHDFFHLLKDVFANREMRKAIIDECFEGTFLFKFGNIS